MEQHPIPQNVTSYEFKLVGEMTLKQFGKAAGGIIIALLINATPVVFFVKWPLAFIFAAGGLAMAFVPFQDRPLETWFVSFIKCVYAPTIYLWKKKIDPNWLDIDLSKKIDTDADNNGVPLPIKDKGKVSEFINSLPSVQKEEVDDSDELLQKSRELKKQKDEEKNKQTEKIETVEKKEEVKVEPTTETTVQNQPAPQTNLNLSKEKLEATGRVVFGSIPMPSTPTEPNVLAGMVTDTESKIIEGAIVEIQDSFGNPVRVLKTNALGQFKASTQLANGEYLVIPEKEPYKFDRVKIQMMGNIVEPIKIQAMTEFNLKQNAAA